VPAPPVPAKVEVPPLAAEETAVAEEAEEAEDEDEAQEADKETTQTAKAEGAKTKTAGRLVASASTSDNRKLLAVGERLLRADRLPEAREIFEKLAKSKRDRGRALVGLAEISFQEKKYAEAARSAALAADRGGGVKARVLLGDAHFRLAQFKEAARAYEEALRIDPSNASAKSGLALATKRM
jgi:tetratricopeptide (TPR) repeat protein